MANTVLRLLGLTGLLLFLWVVVIGATLQIHALTGLRFEFLFISFNFLAFAAIVIAARLSHIKEKGEKDEVK